MSLEPIPYVDVDGDGTVDVLVPTPEPGDCNHDAHFTLFLVRQGCGRAVGTFVGMPEPIERALVACPRSRPRSSLESSEIRANRRKG